MIRDELRTAISQALASAGLPAPASGIELEPPKRRDQGDWSSNIAMKLRAEVGGNPLEIAQKIASAVHALGVPHVAKLEAAPPGFVNFFLSPTWLHDVVRTVVAQDNRYGQSDALAGRNINLEFVSANPTGPLHAGGGRWV